MPEITTVSIMPALPMRRVDATLFCQLIIATAISAKITPSVPQINAARRDLPRT